MKRRSFLPVDIAFPSCRELPPRKLRAVSKSKRYDNSDDKNSFHFGNHRCLTMESRKRLCSFVSLSISIAILEIE